MFRFVVLPCALLFAATASSAAVIDFESITDDPNGRYRELVQYDEDGFVFTSDAIVHPNFPGRFNSENTTSPFWAGSRAIYPAWSPSNTKLARLDGAPFSLVSVDLSEIRRWGNTSFTTRLTFTGARTDGNAVNFSADLDVVFGFQRFFFGDQFNDLLWVTWDNAAWYHQMDNVTVGPAFSEEPDPVTPVPEASTMTLIGLALVGMAAARWRSRAR